MLWKCQAPWRMSILKAHSSRMNSKFCHTSSSSLLSACQLEIKMVRAALVSRQAWQGLWPHKTFKRVDSVRAALCWPSAGLGRGL